MNAIFGATDSPELFSPRNGLTVSNAIEEHFDSGFFVIELKTNPTIMVDDDVLVDFLPPSEPSSDAEDDDGLHNMEIENSTKAPEAVNI
ncbi:hypothetical protein FQN54_006061 [Arachnomyces sp. PD_36]|nr:hypothetical protein FQN54_006061 [Arachnomyces sp. PD_36]